MFKSILLSVQVDPVLVNLVVLALVIIVIGFLLRLIKQPYVIAYIIAGVILGPNVMGVITDEALITELGSFGLILLLFFIGMEISLPQLIANWKISVLGTLAQVLFSIAAVAAVGYWFDWPLNRVFLLGFVISISSTAVAIKILQDKNELQTRAGQNVVGILLAQDIIIVPMLIIISYLNGESPDLNNLGKQLIGGVLLILFVLWMIKKETIKLPADKQLRSDHEIQVFVAFFLCFGFAVLTAFLGLSSALGAFVAGMLISKAKSTEWVHESLHAFRILFVALFFVSIGMLIDLSFILKHALVISLMVAVLFILNNAINTGIMIAFKEKWKESIYAGAILAQIGEFSFILGETGFSIGLINEYAYQLIISIISVSLVISPIWVTVVSKLTKH